MAVSYKQEVIEKIQEIAGNVSLVNGVLYDKLANPLEIRKAIEKYGVEISQQLPEKIFNELLLLNWIYCHYYQNRGEKGNNQHFDEKHFPFKHMSKEGSEAYWRSRFWRFDNDIDLREGPVLTRGYETIVVEAKQFVEDEFVFEAGRDKQKNIFEEVVYLSVVFPKFEIESGQKFAFGEYPMDNDGQGGVMRFYLHLNIERIAISVPVIISKITTLFNERLIPFQLKFLSKSADFSRSDHFMLYLERRHFFVGGMLLKHLYNEIVIFLDVTRLPLFVYPVLPGIGFAKNPSNGELSFGANRSWVIAKAILACKRDTTLPSAEDHLEDVWGGLENFYLNPKPKFIPSLQVFKRRNLILFDDAEEDDKLSAAWYIARLLCREAIWVNDKQCNWMSYCKIEDAFGYRFLQVNNGIKGLEGVILFLEAFRKIGIKDSVIEYVLLGAKEFFTANCGVKIISKNRIDLITPRLARAGMGSIKVLPRDFAGDELKSEIDEIVFGTKTPEFSESGLLNKILINHIRVERPIGNRIDGSDNFCADLEFGLAGYGYAYLRLYDPKKNPSLTQ